MLHTGTLAASLQAGIGNVAAGSLFATAQSVAMGGAVPTIANAVVGIGLGIGVRALTKSLKRVRNEREAQEKAKVDKFEG
ncbi:hypothetical protein C8J57DRAFT_50365 [Mycena rebaudengoi]|nr:hypothetical protein C8J57DRAFT_50365 [Mycena rebaudengoi]